MKKIGFIGVYDKTDMIINVAKILITMKKRVLFIDSTTNQKAKYVVPAIRPTISYITSFEDIDVAVGFENMDAIEKYLGSPSELPYDIILIDSDTPERIDSFHLEMANKNYFVTSLDVYSLKKGMEILGELKIPINMTKVLYAREVLKEDDDYLNFISEGRKIIWDDERIYFPIENGDYSVIAENQRVQKIKFKKLSIQYKDALSIIVQQILNQQNDSIIRKTIKSIERGV